MAASKALGRAAAPGLPAAAAPDSFGRAMHSLDTASNTARAIELQDRHGAHNYNPLPVVIARGEGVWVEDVDGRRYFDALSAYSALNFGHRHPALVAAAERQLGRLTLTSRAFHNERLGEF